MAAKSSMRVLYLYEMPFQVPKNMDQSYGYASYMLHRRSDSQKIAEGPGEAILRGGLWLQSEQGHVCVFKAVRLIVTSKQMSLLRLPPVACLEANGKQHEKK